MNKEVSMDDLFLNKVYEAIDKNLENENFGVEELALEIGISRSQLHRKFKILTGQTTSQTIKEFRLKRAMEMLQNNVATSSEISYKVGFGSPSYFNTCFHEYFGYSPGKVKFKKPAGKKRNTLFSKKPLIISLVVLALVALFYFSSWLAGQTSAKDEKPLIVDKSIAVLPFRNLSDEKENQYFADGQMEAILNHLTRIAELRVISGTTMMGYSGTSKSSPEIARELGVKYVLKGSVQKAGQKVRIIAQLIEAEPDKNLWSKNYDRDLTDIFAIQTEIAKSIAEELRVTISPKAQTRIESVPTSSLSAYDFYLKGMEYHSRSLQTEDFQYAIKMFKRAVEIDPNFTLAWLGLASVSSSNYWFNYEGSEKHLLIIQEYLDKAIALDPELLEVQLEAGIHYYRSKLNYPKALQIMEKLKSDYPNNYQVHAWTGFIYRRMGQFEMFLEYMNKVISFNPADWQNWFATGETLIMLRRYTEAEDYLKTAIELNPSAANNYIFLVLLYLNTGEVDKARTLLESNQNINDPGMYITRCSVELIEGNYQKAISIIESSPHNLTITHEVYKPKSLQLGLIYYLMSNTELANTYFLKAKQILEEKQSEFQNDSRIYSSLGIVYAGLGMNEEAMRANNKAMSIMNTSIDALRGIHRELDMAKILLMIGDSDEAIAKLEFLLQQYSFISVELLKIDPFWDPLRDIDAFKALIENPKYQINPTDNNNGKN
ncbi:MAG: helix-turn-helix domain-containing protein [Bacteroidetes bacterium]|nr:helix-turn-helix domain-containing protein [Bacteroidota bacterium]